MVKPCCDKVGLKTGKWSAKEDQILVSYIQRFGHDRNWHTLTKKAGLLRCGKSCRFRWLNYLRPNIKRGNYTRQEEEVIISIHKKLGNRWSVMAKSLPGRTDNEIKNYWYTYLKKDNSENQEMAETRQLSVKNSASSANKERELQPIPYTMILETPGHDLTYPQSFSNNLVSGNGSSVIKGKEPDEAILDESTQSESTYEFGSSVGSQSQSAEGFSPKDSSPSTFEDPFLQFPRSPLSFGEYEYMGVCCNTEMDILCNYYGQEGEIAYFI